MQAFPLIGEVFIPFFFLLLSRIIINNFKENKSITTKSIRHIFSNIYPDVHAIYSIIVNIFTFYKVGLGALRSQRHFKK